MKKILMVLALLTVVSAEHAEGVELVAGEHRVAVLFALADVLGLLVGSVEADRLLA